jgi:DNA-binding transcriptional LysR family regulator
LLTVGGNELLKVAVKRQVGLGCLSLSAVSPELERGELVIVPMPGTPIERTLSIVQRNRSKPQAILSRFLDYCMADAP